MNADNLLRSKFYLELKWAWFDGENVAGLVDSHVVAVAGLKKERK